ncbi:MAG: T9SS type A sorting domain-containing protein [Bacteroidales bacterium]|nr:T9SS type A sorting domain-containing protein [Bacteroidales bacterium]
MKTLMKKIRLLLSLMMLAQPAFLMSQTNQYLHFDRVDDYCILENGSQYITGTNGISMTGWFYCDELAYGQGYMGFRSGGEGFYLIQLNNGVLECRFANSGNLYEYVAPANTIIPQVWQHISWIYNGSSVTLYVNGALKGSASASGQFSNPNIGFAIGKSILGGFNFVYGGRADEVSVWDKALTQQEVQDIMNDELAGNEPNLQLYYKFNQGDPGGNNTSITHLICEIGNGERDAELMNFALTGPTSNFGGTLDPGFQAISFPQIPNKLTTDDPFEIEATASSGLEVFFEVISGPATIEGNLVTLTGNPGEVKIQATQPGNAQYDPADPVINSFMVIDPMAHVPEIDIRSPLQGEVYVPVLSQIQLAAISTIEYPELFYVHHVKFEINGQNIPAMSFFNDHFEAWWTPPSHGTYTLNVVSTNNFGASATETISINILNNASDKEVTAVDGVWLNSDVPFAEVEAELPSFLGAYNQITGTLEVQCPPGGCGEWDRVASLDAKGHNGEWIEIIRYITPYGVPCTHNIDLTDYMSILQGKIRFRVNCATLDNGYKYYLILNYQAGTPAYLYSTIREIWQDYYPFGDYANLQPVDNFSFAFPDNTVASKLKLVSTGHGWGDLNTGNAAEFYEATHHITINGTQSFEQYNWYACNPNPDGCMPQNGTWWYDRAGWCPGTIAQWFDFNLTPFVQEETIDLGYVFYENYIDYCHPNHPDCVTGVTCSDCSDGFNPALAVACNIVAFAENPFMVGTGHNLPGNETAIKISPNPTGGIVQIALSGNDAQETSRAVLYNCLGKPAGEFSWSGPVASLNLTTFPKGVYILKIENRFVQKIEKLIIQ